VQGRATSLNADPSGGALSRAGIRTLDQLEAVLRELRSFATLVERSPGAFDSGRGHFLHFHDTSDGIVADLFLASGRVRVPANTDTEQAELLALVDESLSGAERRAAASRPKRRTRGRGTGAA